MNQPKEYLTQTSAPTGRPTEMMDVRDLPPPQPLRETLEELGDLDEKSILIQINDRAPQHLYPKLEDRGYAFETIENDTSLVTVIWTP